MTLRLRFLPGGQWICVQRCTELPDRVDPRERPSCRVSIAGNPEVRASYR